MKQALLHALKVFIYAGVSAAAPVWISYLEHDPRYVLFAPLVNALLYGVLRFFKEKYPDSVMASIA